MKKLPWFLIFISLLSCTNPHDQTLNRTEEQEVLEIFRTFFDAMHQRDTIQLKNMILHPHHPYRWFFQQSGFSNQEHLWSSGASPKGFIKGVGSTTGLHGQCRNAFEDVSVEIYDRYAVVSAKYQCFVEDDQLTNCGKYTLQLLKTDQWKIRQVFRYVIKENCPEKENS
jgi:hypothetical protein